MAAKKDAKETKDVKDAAKTAAGVREEKLKALEHTLSDLNKQYGKGAVMKLGDAADRGGIPVISTGCLTLDAALGIVRSIFLPFILVNAVGFTLMITMIEYIEKQRRIALGVFVPLALDGFYMQQYRVMGGLRRFEGIAENGYIVPVHGSHISEAQLLEHRTVFVKGALQGGFQFEPVLSSPWS